MILINSLIINKDQYRIQFFTQPNRRKSILENESYLDVKEFIDFHEYVDISEIPNLLNQSSILLLLSNICDVNGPKGLLSTSKYFEYLAVERPILCVRSDEDLLEASIKKANAGIAARGGVASAASNRRI